MWCGMVQCGAAQCGVVRCGVMSGGLAWCGVVWCGVVWCGAVRCGAACGGGVGWGGLGWGVVCRRCCYQKAMARMVLHAEKCKPGGLCVKARAVCCVLWRFQFNAARGKPFRSACWCSRSNAHDILPPVPARALMGLSWAPVWASHTLCNSDNTCRMNSVPMSCGPASPICAGRINGVAMATGHCSRTTGSHNWPCTCDAQAPHRYLATCGGADGPATTHWTALGTTRGVGLSLGYPRGIGSMCTAARCKLRSAQPLSSQWGGCESGGPPGVSTGRHW